MNKTDVNQTSEDIEKKNNDNLNFIKFINLTNKKKNGSNKMKTVNVKKETYKYKRYFLKK